MKRVGPPCGPKEHHRFGLRKVLFVWLVVVIAVTALAVGLVSYAFGGNRWREEMAGLQRFAENRLAEVWDDPVAREELVRSAERDLNLGVALFDDQRHLLRRPQGETRGTPVVLRVPGGEAHVFAHRPPMAPRFAASLFVAVCVLAIASGALARKLALPIRRVAAVAERLGEGDLDARVGAQRMRGEVGLLADTIDRMAERIQKQLHDQKELLAAVSHELRTPLGHVRVLLELAREGALDERGVDEIEREIVEMDRLVGELLARSRLEFETLDALELDALELARRTLERLALDPALLETSRGADRIAVVGDPTLLGRALANLVENAQRHGGGLVELSVRREDDAVVFALDDRGDGFDERAFDPFVRGDGGRHPSLGLGLALARRIARAHGGDVMVSKRDDGARVELRIGLARAALGRGRGSAEPDERRGTDVSASGSLE
jgi:two-component system OmpR family sensor kinase